MFLRSPHHSMKRLLPLVSLCMILAACTDTTGLSPDSSRGPLGNPNAVVVLTEYADLQCPACKVAFEKINTPLLSTYGDKIRMEFKHFPLQQLHRFALEAAMAAECSADQGKFWEYVDLVYVNQEKLKTEQLSLWAKDLQLDTQLFDRCLASKIKRKTVLADYEEGKELGVSGTPSYFVNGQRVDTGFDTISTAIDAALKGAERKL